MIKELLSKVFLENKISTKILLFTVLFSGLMTLFITIIQLYIDYEHGYQSINKQLNLIKSSYLVSIEQSAWVYDTKQILLQLDGMLNLADIKYASVILEDGMTFERGEKVQTNFIEKEYNITYIYKGKEEILGQLIAIADLNELYKTLSDRIILILTSQGIKTFLSSFFILFLFQILLTRHIKEIIKYTRSLKLGVKREPLVLNKFKSDVHQDELDQLIESINSMENELYKGYTDIHEELKKREAVEKSLIEHKNRLERLYMTDSLTGLGNRIKLIHDLNCKPRLAVAILDIDDFKEINDFYGNKIGDEVIMECASRLKKYTHDSTCEIYRLHSDQFALSYENIINKKKFEVHIKELVSQILKDSIILDEHEIPIAMATGMAINEKELYINADLALQIAKKKHKNFVIYSKEFEIEKEYKENLLWTKKLKQALDENRITAYFQPIYNQQTKKIEKCEALVRMIDTDGSIISPFFFLRVAIKSKLYPRITMIMIDEVIKAAINHDYEFSINFTINDILSHEIRNYFINQVQEHNIASKIVLELVESESIENYEEINNFIAQIKNIGCKIAIDDFGTGYSNFEYLLRLNADYVKIDGSLIKNIDKDENMKLVTQNIINFAKIAKMKTIAEFVFEKNIMDIMRNLDVDYIQGYYISEPIPYKELRKFETFTMAE